MNIWKLLTILFLGYSVICTLLARQLVKELEEVRNRYEIVTGYVLEVGGIKYVRVDGADWLDGDIIRMKIDVRDTE